MTAYIGNSDAIEADEFIEKYGDVQIVPSTNERAITSVEQDAAKNRFLLPDAKFPKDLVYDSYAGTDIVMDLVLPDNEPVTLGELQTFSYSMHRKKHPVRTVGHVAPRGYARGSRTLAGSMIFTVFNFYAFYRLPHMRDAISTGLFGVADMLPPFDVNLTFANEHGSFSKMRIYGMSFVDEGGTMSIDDMLTESTFSYVARGIQPLTARGLLDGNK